MHQKWHVTTPSHILRARKDVLNTVLSVKTLVACRTDGCVLLFIPDSHHSCTHFVAAVDHFNIFSQAQRSDSGLSSSVPKVQPACGRDRPGGRSPGGEEKG